MMKRKREDIIMKKTHFLFLLLSLVIVQPVKAEDIQEVLCKTLKSYYSTPEECAKCPNREVDKRDYCVLKECPENHFRNAAGTCLPCDTLEAPYPRVSEDAECLKCSNRTMVRTKDMPDPECILKECPPNHVRIANGSCVSNQIFTFIPLSCASFIQAAKTSPLKLGFCGVNP